MNVSLTLVVLYTCIVKTVDNFMSNEHERNTIWVVLYTCNVETVGYFITNERITHLSCAINLYCRNIG